jgi:hypothetical protein
MFTFLNSPKSWSLHHLGYERFEHDPSLNKIVKETKGLSQEIKDLLVKPTHERGKRQLRMQVTLCCSYKQ